MDNTFTCAACYKIYEKVLTEEEAVEQLNKEFPGISKEHCLVICDACYKEFLGVDQ